VLGPVVEVAIGLVFTYLLFAMLLSTLMEAWAGLRGLRAKRLEATLQRLLATQEAPAAGAAAAPVPVPLSFDAVYGHPLIAGTTKNKPSYVAADDFATALLYALRVGQTAATLADQVAARIKTLPEGPLRTALDTALQEAGGDWAKVKTGVENWYDHAMDRMSGEYKRYSQLITFVIGLTLASIFNVNSITIIQRLFTEPVLRHSLEVQAEAFVKNPPKTIAHPPSTPATPSPADQKADAPVDAAAAVAAIRDAQAMLLATAPVGWDNAPKTPGALFARIGASLSDLPQMFGWIFTLLPGWLLTALAGMLGAPFWFDLLGKLISIRNAGPKPPNSDAAPPKGGVATP
jgi:hypothetical protein